MNQNRIAPTVAALALLWPAFAPGQTNREISGVVVNARSGQPVPGAAMTLRQSRDLKVVAQTSSDAEGHFAFPNLGDGKFGVIAVAKGYVPSAYQEHEPGVSTAIVTGESMVTTGLRFELPPLARIQGEVQEDSGDPVPNARVSLYRKDPNGTGAMARVRVGSADATGSFEFAGLGEGTYFACAVGSPWYARPMQPWRRPGAEEVSNRLRSTLDVAYPPTCYPETTEPAQAEAIRVNAGDVLPVTIIMHPEPAVHIVMQVPRPDQQHPFIPPQFATRIFGAEEQVQANSTFWVEGNGENADAPARMEITGLTAGQYEISVPRQNGEPGRHMSADLAPDHASLELAAANALPDVTGQVVTANGENLRPGSYIWLFPHHAGNANAAPVQADGTFTFPVFRAGEYDVRVVTPGTRIAIVSMAAKGGELSGHVLKVGNQPVKLAIVAAEAKATVNGIATRHGSPVSGVFIVMVPANPRSVSEQLQTNQSDSDGSFNFLRVAPGAYVVVAIEEGWKLDWARPEAIAPYLEKGVRVTVPADPREINLPLSVEAQPANPNPPR